MSDGGVADLFAKNPGLRENLTNVLSDLNQLSEKDEMSTAEYDDNLTRREEEREALKEKEAEHEALFGEEYSPTENKRKSAFASTPNQPPISTEVPGMSTFDDLFPTMGPSDDSDENYDNADFSSQTETSSTTDSTPGDNENSTNRDTPHSEPPESGQPPVPQPQVPTPPPIPKPESNLPVDEIEETFTDDPEPDTNTATEKPQKEKKESIIPQILGNKKLLLMIGGIIGILLLIILVVTATLGGGKESDSAAPEAAPPPAAAPGQPAPANNGFAEQPQEQKEQIIQPASKEAKCEGGVSTDIGLAFDGDTNTAWICQRSLGIDGNTAHFTFDHPVVITDLRIIAGNAQITASGEDQWEAFRRVKRINVFVSGQPNVYTLNGDKGGDIVTLTNPTATTDITMVIQQTEGSEATVGKDGTADAFAVSTIEFHGHDAA